MKVKCTISQAIAQAVELFPTTDGVRLADAFRAHIARHRGGEETLGSQSKGTKDGVQFTSSLGTKTIGVATIDGKALHCLAMLADAASIGLPIGKASLPKDVQDWIARFAGKKSAKSAKSAKASKPVEVKPVASVEPVAKAA